MIAEIVIGFIEKIYMFIFLWRILQFKFEKTIYKRIGAIVLFLLSEVVLYAKFQLLIKLIFWVCLQIIAVNLLFKGIIVRNSIGFWFSYFFTNIIYVFVGKMLNIGVGIFAVRVNKVLVNGVSGIVVSFLFWQIGKWIKSQAKRKVILQKMSTLHYFTGMVCGMIANGLNNCIVYLGEERIAFFPIFVQTFIHVMIVSLCMLCIAFIFLHIFFVECKRECRRKEQYIESLKKYYKEQDGYVKEVRAIKHDIQAHMNVLCNYLELGKVEKALEYLRKMTEYEKLKDIKFYDVGNEVVNMILYESIARSNVCITVECLGNIPKELLLSDYDLCVIFSNLLSNSVEACEKLKIYDKKIRLEMKQYKNHFFIKIQNPIEWEIDVDKLSVISSKADKKCHGYGILNIKKIVKKYEGEIIFNKKDDIFEVEILFLEVVKDFILPS